MCDIHIFSEKKTTAGSLYLFMKNGNKNGIWLKENCANNSRCQSDKMGKNTKQITSFLKLM